MSNTRYLTKSRFKLGLDCPTKLFYTGKKLYPDRKIDDSFLAALAKGGFQVGELAKCYFPGGVNIDELDHQTALDKTNLLLAAENAIIYEAAISFQNLFIRADILEKKGNVLNIYEVKAKSVSDAFEVMTTNKGMPKSEWKPYLCDIAFQKYVLKSAYPNMRINAFLMVADKSKLATVDGLNQKFMLSTMGGRATVKVVGAVDSVSLGQKILCTIAVDEIIERINNEPVFDTFTGKSFRGLIDLFQQYYSEDKLLQGELKAYCRDCEFRATPEEEALGKMSGYKQCWTAVNGFTESDFEKPSVLHIWNYRGRDKLIAEGRFFQHQVTIDDLISKNAKASEVGLSSSERQWLQVSKAASEDQTHYFDNDGLKDIFAKFQYPLHFIDFETTAVAIPFHAGRRPYEQIAFQFSHHTVSADGSIAHMGEWINTEQGKFPNFEFVRQLKKELEQDNGTIFRYAPHENTILNAIFRQLKDSSELDREELCTWIKTITKSTGNSAEEWEGERNMVDLWDLVKKYYYAPQTNGSNSIKYVLPALLNGSDYLKAKYSEPIYGRTIKSLNFTNHTWIRLDGAGDIINPYELLEPIFKGVDSDVLDEFLTGDEGEIRDGGAAMVAYAQMQFTQMPEAERMLITKSLLKYCELDTLAMVMIWDEWNDKITKKQ